jgi:hypothetical protein
MPDFAIDISILKEPLNSRNACWCAWAYDYDEALTFWIVGEWFYLRDRVPYRMVCFDLNYRADIPHPNIRFVSPSSRTFECGWLRTLIDIRPNIVTLFREMTRSNSDDVIVGGHWQVTCTLIINIYL